jgi:hypothetical protein
MKFIITEVQSEKLNHKIKSMVNKYGLNHAIELFNGKDVIKRAYQDNPSEYLNQFNDLSVVEVGNIVYYVDNNRIPLFLYYKNEVKDGYIFINYERIWLFFSNVIGLKKTEIQVIMKDWLKEIYNLRGLTPINHHLHQLTELEETYNIKLRYEIYNK